MEKLTPVYIDEKVYHLRLKKKLKQKKLKDELKDLGIKWV